MGRASSNCFKKEPRGGEGRRTPLFTAVVLLCSCLPDQWFSSTGRTQPVAPAQTQVVRKGSPSALLSFFLVLLLLLRLHFHFFSLTLCLVQFHHHQLHHRSATRIEPQGASNWFCPSSVPALRHTLPGAGKHTRSFQQTAALLPPTTSACGTCCDLRTYANNHLGEGQIQRQAPRAPRPQLLLISSFTTLFTSVFVSGSQSCGSASIITHPLTGRNGGPPARAPSYQSHLSTSARPPHHRYRRQQSSANQGKPNQRLPLLFSLVCAVFLSSSSCSSFSSSGINARVLFASLPGTTPPAGVNRRSHHWHPPG